MHVLIALARFTLGGTETYSVTVAEQLERLGHGVTLLAPEATPAGRELAALRGLRLRVGDPGPLDDVDAALVQDAASSYLLAGRRPGLRQVFVIHGLATYEHPPAGLAPSPAVVVLNDRIGRHVAALASDPPLVRMCQPIDLERFRPRGASRPRAQRVLLLSNYLNGDRIRLLEDVCGDLGLDLARVGSSGIPTLDPQTAIAEADIVVGYGRCILEAMAMGRAAYVWDYGGGDGWVTPDSYPAIEADGFSGAGSDTVVNGDRLRADFATYSPELGTFGFDLVRMHHSATKHAEQLVGLLGAASAPATDDAFETLARFVRLEFRAAIRVDQLEAESRSVWEELEAARAREASAVEAGTAERALRLAAEKRLQTVLGSRSWRAAAPLRRAAARLRRDRSKQGADDL